MDPRDPRWKTAEARQARTSPNKELLTKWMEYLKAPEKELIGLYDALANEDPESAKHVDQAIDFLAKTRKHIDFARALLKDW